MTITKEAWDEIEEEYGDYIHHNEKMIESIVEQVELVTDDCLAKFRNTPIGQWLDGNNELRNESCDSYVEKLIAPILKTVNNTPCIVYVLSLDPLNQRRPEKKATSEERREDFIKRQQKSGAPTELTLPRGQSRFFEKGCDMPGSMEMIFSTFLAKAQFYAFLTEQMKSEQFRAHIPLGKMVVLSGGVDIDYSDYAHPNVTNSFPLFLSQERIEIREDIPINNISEGDLDVWRWVDYFKDMNFAVHSYDRDLFLISLIQARHIYKDNENRKGWYVTRRGDGNTPPSEKDVQKKQLMNCARGIAYYQTLKETNSVDEAYRASGGYVPPHDALASTLEMLRTANQSSASESSLLPPMDDFSDPGITASSSNGVRYPIVCDTVPTSSGGSRKRTTYEITPTSSIADDRKIYTAAAALGQVNKKPRNHINWLTLYCDVIGIHTEMIKKAKKHYENVVASSSSVSQIKERMLQNPAETYALALALASGKHDYIRAKKVAKGIASHFIWTAVKKHILEIGDMVQIYAPNNSNNTVPYHFYVVNVDSLERLIKFAYLEKCRHSMKETKVNNTPEKLDKAQRKKAMENFYKFVKPRNLQMVASQCAWLLQYWGNSIIPGYTIVDGIIKDSSSNLSIYGFSEKGWEKYVLSSLEKICPPVDFSL